MSNFFKNYFLVLYSILPISIIVGSSISLINIIIIDLSFLIFFIKNKNFQILKNKNLKYLIFLYFYLIFNIFTSLNYSESILRNLGFLRLIILFISINYFFRDNNFSKKVFIAWSLIIFTVVLDVFFESIFGKNIFGYGGTFGGKGGSRIVSFFKDEPIVGGYLFAFIFLVIGHLSQISIIKNNNYFLFTIAFIMVLSIILTGERSNSIKAVIGIFLIFIFIKNIDLKKKIIFFSSLIIIFSSLILNSEFLKLRFIEQFKSNINKDSIYFKLYRSGYEVFKNYPITGVGNKNYRVETCSNINQKNKDKYICTTHPHQIFIELLSEHGIMGTLIIIFLLYKLIFSKIFMIIRENNQIQLGALIYLILMFVPLLPSGAFFSDYMITLFGLNLSLLYAVNKKTNIFEKIIFNKGPLAQ